jgi:T-complex protein 1 subunit gamma
VSARRPTSARSSLSFLSFFFFFLSLTNDGNAILREIDVAHPAAKNMIELSRTQDEECGDGTTSVIVLGMSA